MYEGEKRSFHFRVSSVWMSVFVDNIKGSNKESPSKVSTMPCNFASYYNLHYIIEKKIVRKIKVSISEADFSFLHKNSSVPNSVPQNKILRVYGLEWVKYSWLFGIAVNNLLIVMGNPACQDVNDLQGKTGIFDGRNRKIKGGGIEVVALTDQKSKNISSCEDGFNVHIHVIT